MQHHEVHLESREREREREGGGGGEDAKIITYGHSVMFIQSL